MTGWTDRHFRELTPKLDTAVWRDWFTGHGIDPDAVAWDGWVERREHAIVHLAHSTRDGEPIHQQRVRPLGRVPDEFPDGGLSGG